MQQQSKQLSDTGLSYRTNTSWQEGKDSHYFDKQNVVPCGAQLQTLISTLTQRKHTLKHLMIQKQKLASCELDQQSLIQKQQIKQDYQSEMEESLLRKNNQLFDQIKKAGTQKMWQMQNMMAIKKSLQEKYNQIMTMKSYLTQLRLKQKDLVGSIQEMETKNHEATSHNSDLDLMQQTMNNQVYDAKEAVRLSEGQHQTVASTCQSFKTKIKQCIKQHSQKNKEGRELAAWWNQGTEKLKAYKGVTAENQMRYSEYKIRNGQIQQVNHKLRGDLQKCQNHLKCVVKNNEILTNSIEEFSFAGQQVTRIINRHDIQKL